VVKDIQKFLELYKSGLSRKQASIESGVPEGSGSYLLRKYDVETRSKGFQLGNNVGKKIKKKNFENIKRNCIFCNSEFEIDVYVRDGGDLDKRYCSKECADKDRGLKHRGSNHWNWQGGKPRTRKEMNTIEYKTWRKQVFERDNYTCQICGERGKVINAHHIKSWKDFSELRYDVSNGQTLCNKHHIETHSRRHR